jgi:hypothetical protein
MPENNLQCVLGLNWMFLIMWLGLKSELNVIAKAHIRPQLKFSRVS